MPAMPHTEAPAIILRMAAKALITLLNIYMIFIFRKISFRLPEYNRFRFSNLKIIKAEID